MSESRRVRRGGFPLKEQVSLLNDDMDDTEADIRGVTRLLVGFLVSLTLAAVALAVRLTFGG